MGISKIETIQEFTNDNITYGAYFVTMSTKYIFIRNGDSVGCVQYYYDKPADQCVSIIRDDVKEEFFTLLALKKLIEMD